MYISVIIIQQVRAPNRREVVMRNKGMWNHHLSSTAIWLLGSYVVYSLVHVLALASLPSEVSVTSLDKKNFWCFGYCCSHCCLLDHFVLYTFFLLCAVYKWSLYMWNVASVNALYFLCEMNRREKQIKIINHYKYAKLFL